VRRAAGGPPGVYMKVTRWNIGETIREILPITVDREGEEGFAIITNKRQILLLIDNSQQCCENWGYFLTEDDLNRFIGATLLDIVITDTCRNTKALYKHLRSGVQSLDCGDILFVDIVTERGILQFVAYNEHNGYYGHRARIAIDENTVFKKYL